MADSALSWGLECLVEIRGQLSNHLEDDLQLLIEIDYLLPEE